MEQAPSIPRSFYIRMFSLLSLLQTIDFLLVAYAAQTILVDGPSVMIMFASEYMILLATLVATYAKFGVNCYDLRSEVPWDNKSVWIFYIDLACDFVKLATYLGFFSLILTFYGLPLNILRDVYITARSFVIKVRDLARYRQATRNMDQRYPNATAEEMERMSDKTCIICREDMEARQATPAVAPAQPAQAPENPQPAPAAVAAAPGRQGPNDTPKKLPCGHIFHFHCLRSWLERQQSCPTWYVVLRYALSYSLTYAFNAAGDLSSRPQRQARPTEDDHQYRNRPPKLNREPLHRHNRELSRARPILPCLDKRHLRPPQLARTIRLHEGEQEQRIPWSPSRVLLSQARRYSRY